ncbi:MAG: hypothetical protein WC994_10180 [Brumimicrobium sp.]
MDLNLPNRELQERQVIALEQLAQGKTPLNKTIYGIRGLGQENPILTRTYDAKSVTLDIVTNGDFKEVYASDQAFQDFFNFPEHTDALGNVFITITPKSFRFDLTSNGEIIAISVKEYEDGDEELGFHVHSAFKKWVTETAYDGVGSIQIAKYNNSAYDVNYDDYADGISDIDDIRVRSVEGVTTDHHYASWDDGLYIVKNTHSDYNLLHWMYLDLMRMLMVIYFARTDIHNMFEIPFDWAGDNWEETTEKSSITGNTDGMDSHTGFKADTRQYRIFGLDDFITGTTINGCYVAPGQHIYSHLFHFDALNDDGGLTSSLPKLTNYGDGDFDIITKLGFDPLEPAFKVPVALRPTTSETPEDSVQNIYYSSKGIIPSDSQIAGNEQNQRGQLYAFSYRTQYIFPDNGIFYSRWYDGFYYAWDCDYYSSARLCKPPF